MKATKSILAILVFALMGNFLSCRKTQKDTTQTQPTYVNRVLQDPSFRIGKWVSRRDSLTDPYGSVQDTLWFVSDSVAGYSNGGQPYNWGKYYFWLDFYIVFVDPGITNPYIVDTVKEQCYTYSDTFWIMWGAGTSTFQEDISYLKVK